MAYISSNKTIFKHGWGVDLEVALNNCHLINFLIWLQYYACSDWLFCFCNDWALLARCPKHNYTFCVYLDSGHPNGHQYYGQLTAVKKDIRWPVSSDCIAASIVQLIVFFKVIRWPVAGFIDHRLGSIMKRPCNK